MSAPAPKKRITPTKIDKPAAVEEKAKKSLKELIQVAQKLRLELAELRGLRHGKMEEGTEITQAEKDHEEQLRHRYKAAEAAVQAASEAEHAKISLEKKTIKAAKAVTAPATTGLEARFAKTIDDLSHAVREMRGIGSGPDHPTQKDQGTGPEGCPDGSIHVHGYCRRKPGHKRS